jgi:hypothetical protein
MFEEGKPSSIDRVLMVCFFMLYRPCPPVTTHALPSRSSENELKGRFRTRPDGTGVELVPVVTRVLKQNADGTYADGTHATDWGIQVGGHYYQAPMPVDQNNQACTQQCYGYQILLLNREDLTPIPNSNMPFEVANYAEIQPIAPFVQELSSLGQGNFDTPPYPGKVAPAACQLMVMQSLAQIGYNPCYNGSDPNYFAKCSPFVDDPNADSEGEDLRGTGWWPGILQVSTGNSSDPMMGKEYARPGGLSR